MIITDPALIEARSMEIIEASLPEGIPQEVKPIVKRVIHATADFDYAENLFFLPGAVERGLEALKRGCAVVTDTEMGRAGINKNAAGALGCEIFCFMSDPEVAKRAREQGRTRAAVSMEMAAALHRPTIFAVGNAPTALLELRRLMDVGAVSPELIIGVPVGFVNILEAKEAILTSSAPHIVARGRKGGSTVAAAIVNALMYMLTR